jgi:hypothetical protein
MQENTSVSLYVVKGINGTYFAGFDSLKNCANFTNNPLAAKKFSNKNDVRIRPEEMLVEISFDLANTKVMISEPFRPVRKIALGAKTPWSPTEKA